MRVNPHLRYENQLIDYAASEAGSGVRRDPHKPRLSSDTEVRETGAAGALAGLPGGREMLRESSLSSGRTAVLEEFKQEAEMLQRLRHPNILNFYGACIQCHPVRPHMTALPAVDMVIDCVMWYPRLCTAPACTVLKYALTWVARVEAPSKRMALHKG